MATQSVSEDLYELAKGFLLHLNDKPEAAPYLAAYDMRVQFDVRDGSSFYAVLRDGKVQSVEPGRFENFSNRDDIELFGQEDGFRLIFEKRTTPATAMYYGKVTPKGERGKHCQAALTYTLLRIGQEPDWIGDL